MEIVFNRDKDKRNIAKHGLSLAAAAHFDLQNSIILVDDRHDYRETRYIAFGRMDGLGYCLVFTYRGVLVRPISFRRAHEKEMRRHG